MDFKKFRIAVLSTALLFATNALAVATPKVDSNTESQPVSETQYGEEATLGQTGRDDTSTESGAAESAAEETISSSYP